MTDILLIHDGMVTCKSFKAILGLPQTEGLRISSFMTPAEIRQQVEPLLAKKPKVIVFNVEFRRREAIYQPEVLLGGLAAATETAIVLRLDSPRAVRNPVMSDETIRRLVRFVIVAGDRKKYRSLQRTFPNVRKKHFFKLRDMGDQPSPLHDSLEEMLKEAA